jgi:peptidoglycan/xylan/chitin deacetylase (PgdA/CDA1 family)
MSRVMVLMYHALYADAAEREAIDATDRPYAVSVENFGAQLDWLARARIPVAEPLALPDVPLSVVLTFDDGHVSNYRHAWPMLRERHWPGVFFVTSDFIGRRRGFCEWAQLREMAAGGMQIGSHGKTHRFLDDLGDDELDGELRESRAAIESGVGRAAELLSFPGGRYRRRQLETGRAAGYRLFFSSDVGVNRRDAVRPGRLLRRMAIREATSLKSFGDIARCAPLVLARSRAVSALKASARRVAGNRLYHALYERFST